MVSEFIDEGSFVRFCPSEASISRQERVDLVWLKAKVRPNVASSHDEPNCILNRVERCIVVKVRDAVHVKPAAVRRAIDFLSFGIHFWCFQVIPGTPFVIGDHRTNDTLSFAF